MAGHSGRGVQNGHSTMSPLIIVLLVHISKLIAVSLLNISIPDGNQKGKGGGNKIMSVILDNSILCDIIWSLIPI